MGTSVSPWLEGAAKSKASAINHAKILEAGR